MVGENKPKRRIMYEFDDGDEIIERPIKDFGNSSHVILPQKHAGRKAIVIITDSIRENGKEKEIKDEE